MNRVKFFRIKRKLRNMFIKRLNRRKLYFFLGVLGLLFIIYKINDLSDYDCDAAIIIDKSFANLPPELLNENTIFFLETTNSSDHKINAREACAIESAGN
jgi:hypothetical protein